MNFYNYMIRNYKGNGTVAHCLANAMRMDRDRFPRNGIRKLGAWRALILDYIKDHPELYAGGIDAFDNCWEDYSECEKSKLRKRS